MLSLYNAALAPLRAALTLRAAWGSRSPEGAREWAERRALKLPSLGPGGTWIHGASVGEAKLVALIARAIRARIPAHPLAVSCVTRTGRALLPGPPLTDAAFFAPLDFRGLPGRVLDALRPRALVLVETELWPNLLHEARLRSVMVFVVNGRLGPERMPRYRRLAALYRPLLSALAAVGAQSEADARRFVELGVPEARVKVTGNLKYDLPAPEVDADRLRSRLGLDADRPVLVAGSTGEGEEEQVLDAFRSVRRAHPRAFLVLAPRHVERAEQVEREAVGRALVLTRLSRETREAGTRDGLLVDTLGDLAGLYTLASAAFVGGSLVPIGGHNVLEPAAAGAPVLFGPHTHHVEEPARALEQAGGALRVRDADELAAAWSALLADPARRERMKQGAVALIRASAGAVERSVDLVLSGVPALQPAAPGSR